LKNYYTSLLAGTCTSGKKIDFSTVSGSPTITNKTVLGWLASTVLLLALFAGQFAAAQTFDVGGLRYTTTGATTVSVGKTDTCPTGAITIPATVTNGATTYNVTSIGNSAFQLCTSLTTVTIPNSVTSIGTSAFQSCISLTAVTIPNSVTSIRGSTFLACTSLTTVAIPSSVTSIENFAFNSCTSLNAVTIPNSVTSIGDYAFGNCSSLTSVTIPNSVTSIGDGAFEYCTSLTSVTIPNSVTSIGDYAFEYCTSLTSVTCEIVNPLTIDTDLFGEVTLSNVTLNVPAASVSAYQAAAVWEDFNPINAIAACTPSTYYADADNDGFGDPAVSQQSCTQPEGYVLDNTDCDDAVFAINPLATEICWNNIDDNCNDTKSEGCAAIPVFVNNPVTITNFSTHLSAMPYTYAGATSLDYRFEITNTSVMPNQTVTFTQTGIFARFFTIPTSIRGFNTTYSIRASAVINGEEVPYAVPVITVTSTGIPTVNIAPTSCGVELSRLNATISASPGFNAISYTFRIRETSDNGAMPTYYYAESPSRFIGASSFVGLNLQYNTSYSVSVQYTTASVGAAVTAITAEYGEECIITTPRIPVIGLSTPTCGTTLDRLGATISATPATYAVQYQFRVRLTSDNGPTPTYYTTIPSASRFSSLTATQGLVVANSTQYSVSVRYSIPAVGGGTEFSDYDSSECIVQTPIAAVPRTLAASFKVVAYPNPFLEGFQLDVKTENAGIVSIKTYDMLGRLIEERSSKVNTLESLTIGSNYPSGVYNVIVSQEDEIRTVRVVKR
jgi:hypothetical protein